MAKSRMKRADIAGIAKATGIMLEELVKMARARAIPGLGKLALARRKALCFSLAMLSIAALPLGATNTWVAQPRRAEQVDWPIPSFAGRDFWTLLDSCWLDLPALRTNGLSRIPVYLRSSCR